VSEELTWTCHVCGELRPDSAISTIVRGYLVGPRAIEIKTSMRYCNDRPACRELAEISDRFRPRGATPHIISE